MSGIAIFTFYMNATSRLIKSDIFSIFKIPISIKTYHRPMWMTREEIGWIDRNGTLKHLCRTLWKDQSLTTVFLREIFFESFIEKINFAQKLPVIIIKFTKMLALKLENNLKMKNIFMAWFCWENIYRLKGSKFKLYFNHFQRRY